MMLVLLVRGLPSLQTGPSTLSRANEDSSDSNVGIISLEVFGYIRLSRSLGTGIRREIAP